MCVHLCIRGYVKLVLFSHNIICIYISIVIIRRYLQKCSIMEGFTECFKSVRRKASTTAKALAADIAVFQHDTMRIRYKIF